MLLYFGLSEAAMWRQHVWQNSLWTSCVGSVKPCCLWVNGVSFKCHSADPCRAANKVKIDCDDNSVVPQRRPLTMCVSGAVEGRYRLAHLRLPKTRTTEREKKKTSFLSWSNNPYNTQYKQNQTWENAQALYTGAEATNKVWLAAAPDCFYIWWKVSASCWCKAWHRAWQ